jgi:hypothetical protein
LLDSMQQQLDSRNSKTADSIWTISDFIRRAVMEKLNHYRRSKAQAKYYMNKVAK